MYIMNIVFFCVFCWISALECMLIVNCTSNQLNNKHWKLFRWYFQGVPTIEITYLLNNESTSVNCYNEKMINHLTKELSVAVLTFATSCCSKTTHSQMTENVNEDETADILQVSNFVFNERLNRDEKQKGVVLLYSSLDSITRYVSELPLLHHPFHDTASNYIFIDNLIEIHSTPKWRQQVSKLFELLFQKHRILNAIFVAFSDHQDNNEIGFYDPFHRSSSNTELNINAWGAMKWTRLSDIVLQSYSVSSLTHNFREYPFRAAMFRRFPTVLPSSELSPIFISSYLANVAQYAANFSGFDSIVLGNIARYYNFNVTPVLNNEAKYGTKLANATFSGVLGDVITEKADGAFNSRFIIDYGTDNVDFLYPLISDRYCVIAPAALPKPKWAVMLNCFSISVWTYFLGLLLISSFCWCLLRTRNSLEVYNTFRFESAFDVYKIVVMQPVVMPTNQLERLYLAILMITHIIVMGIVQGSLARSFSTPNTYAEINTLQQLDDSGLPIISSTASIKNMFGNSDERPLLRSLQAKHQTREFTTAIQLAAFDRSACSVERFLDINILIKTQFQRTDGSNLVHIVAECPRNYHLAFIIKRGSPYKTRFNRILSVFFEAGFLRLWYDHVEHAIIVSRRKDLVYSNMAQLNISLYDMDVVIELWAIGMLIAILVFLIENKFK